ncbi:hypothetical protein BDR26DRAFT_840128 [Obelidium mucronatum]|nr:hypothetical protein BDR26DRAFT_840128 [Obelidium mucronatum]
MKRDIWYLLVDDRGDPAFKRASPYFVSFATEDRVVVSHFARKVWEENKDGILSSVDAHDFEIFSNKKDVCDPTKAFKASELVGDRGANKDQPLLVHVSCTMTTLSYAPGKKRVFIFRSFDKTCLSNEGIDNSSPKTLGRKSIAKEIADKLNHDLLLLYTGSPMCGKTSMAGLVGHHLAEEKYNSGGDTVIISFSVGSLLRKSNLGSDWRFENLFDWLSDPTLSWYNLLQAAMAGTTVVVIIDDAHLIYCNAVAQEPHSTSPYPFSTFWTVFKAFGVYQSNLKILLFADYAVAVHAFYGLSSFAEIPRENIYNLPCIEDHEIMAYFRANYTAASTMSIDESAHIAACLKSLVGNHVGLLSMSVAVLNNLNKDKHKNLTANELVENIWSECMFNTLKSCRAGPMMMPRCKAQQLEVFECLFEKSFQEQKQYE